MGSIAAQAQRKGNTVGGSGESFCRRWSCVTSNDGDWKWPISLQDRVKFSFVNSGLGKYKVMELYKDKSCSPSDLDYLKTIYKKATQTIFALQGTSGKVWKYF